LLPYPKTWLQNRRNPSLVPGSGPAGRSDKTPGNKNAIANQIDRTEDSACNRKNQNLNLEIDLEYGPSPLRLLSDQENTMA
jgi:hypothetical protein